MRRKGVLYDVGRVLWGINWRPVFDPVVDASRVADHQGRPALQCRQDLWSRRRSARLRRGDRSGSWTWRSGSRRSCGIRTLTRHWQARRIAEDLTILEAAGVDGAFVCTFLEPLSTHDPDPRYDLDMGALSLVNTYASGQGITYPDMTWEPKKAFHAVTSFYTERATRP